MEKIYKNITVMDISGRTEVFEDVSDIHIEQTDDIGNNTTGWLCFTYIYDVTRIDPSYEISTRRTRILGGKIIKTTEVVT